LRIDHDDLAVGVDDHHAIGRRLQQITNVGPYPFGVLVGDVGSEAAEETHEFLIANGELDHTRYLHGLQKGTWDEMIDDL
jgi:hypothetical protein